ncbi:MAG: hypothetical protein A2538_03005 [Candidatus Magasanikbacteria bacterium RIFOXYD2_FULL_41_14]|uniref:DUF559 domain-containing protein n=1 Tax=Candidatus Magasanikbacteria bacterium RIFOXYD2_FULL_41_14 TaxID=1798709 RepID=A0A1F6PCC4_9BACT|nr:MAG: hypothetical protein A2538_03005 [Candidatus Magasanikbacteria bacterium RIFOXYD2_FULL_41_14]
MAKVFNKKEQIPIRKRLRNNITKSEMILWKYLKGSQMNGWKFRRQQGIGNYIVDFYCPDLKIVVEVDGLTHSEEVVFEKDEVRQEYLENLGLKVVRYNSQDIFYKINDVLEGLYNICLELSKANV